MYVVISTKTRLNWSKLKNKIDCLQLLARVYETTKQDLETLSSRTYKSLSRRNPEACQGTDPCPFRIAPPSGDTILSNLSSFTQMYILFFKYENLKRRWMTLAIKNSIPLHVPIWRLKSTF